MKFINKAALRGSTSVCAALAALTAFGTPAFAQDANTKAGEIACTDDNNDKVCDGDEITSADNSANTGSIVVTGSRIRQPNLQSPVPVSSISGDAIFQNSDQNVGELLNDLPQLRIG